MRISDLSSDVCSSDLQLRRVSQIMFKEGQRVARGTVVVALDSAIAAAELAQARARLELSRSNFQRASELRQRGVGTERSLDEAEIARESCRERDRQEV